MFLVRHKQLDCHRAIKRIPKNARIKNQLINEAHILKNLRHPNIPIIHDIEEDNDYFYIVEEYVEGQSLRAIRLSQSYFRESRIVEILIQLCDVLNFLHSRKDAILYLDLKPDNIIMSGKGIKLIDFGTAIFVNKSEERTQSFGTKGFAAPEQYGLNHVDERSDIYGLGGIIYFLITGEIYRGTKEDWKRMEQTFHCSKKLKKIIKKCLRVLPGQRYSSVLELRKHLERIWKKKGIPEADKKAPHIIAVAGNLSRIGTTHISLMIAAYLSQRGIKVAYVEVNENRIVKQLTNSLKGKTPFLMVRGTLEVIQNRYEEESYEILICDYGFWSCKENKYPGAYFSEESKAYQEAYFSEESKAYQEAYLSEESKAYQEADLSEENKKYQEADLSEENTEYQEANLQKGGKKLQDAHFLKGDKKLLVVGGKPWEQGEWPHMDEDVICLINFMGGRDFFALSRQHKNQKCVRVPFEPNYLKPPNNPIIREFMKEILDEILET